MNCFKTVWYWFIWFLHLSTGIHEDGFPHTFKLLTSLRASISHSSHLHFISLCSHTHPEAGKTPFENVLIQISLKLFKAENCCCLARAPAWQLLRIFEAACVGPSDGRTSLWLVPGKPFQSARSRATLPHCTACAGQTYCRNRSPKVCKAAVESSNNIFLRSHSGLSPRLCVEPLCCHWKDVKLTVLTAYK